MDQPDHWNGTGPNQRSPLDGTESVRRFAASQMVGVRERQEDDFATYDLGDDQGKGFLFVVADGMGGHEGAATVTQLAVRRFCEIARSGDDPLSHRLNRALLGANEAIARAGAQDKSLAGAGCAFLSAAIENEKLSWISAGDCSLSLFRRGELRQLNEDHSMRSELRKMVAAGQLSATAASQDPRRSMLRSALRGSDIRLIDASSQPLPLIPGDVVILASDGLETLKSRALARILNRAASLDAAGVVDRLMNAIRTLRNRQQDNVTIICYRVADTRFGRPPEPGTKAGLAVPLLILVVVLLLATAYGLSVFFG
jgi:serine/threonine protein phosphatase PrpC